MAHVQWLQRERGAAEGVRRTESADICYVVQLSPSVVHRPAGWTQVFDRGPTAPVVVGWSHGTDLRERTEGRGTEERIMPDKKQRQNRGDANCRVERTEGRTSV